jgi:hypothetical protein
MSILSNAEQISSVFKLQHESKTDSGKIFRENRDTVVLNRCDAGCPSFNLCKKRILIVGGITRMESLYRELIEGHGGIFEYHNGYVKNGVKKLESSFKRADIVVCPVNCNSHAACIIVKNLGKKHRKTVCMLASFSLSSVARAILGADKAKGAIN